MCYLGDNLFGTETPKGCFTEVSYLVAEGTSSNTECHGNNTVSRRPKSPGGEKKGCEKHGAGPTGAPGLVIATSHAGQTIPSIRVPGEEVGNFGSEGRASMKKWGGKISVENSPPSIIDGPRKPSLAAGGGLRSQVTEVRGKEAKAYQEVRIQGKLQSLKRKNGRSCTGGFLGRGKALKNAGDVRNRTERRGCADTSVLPLNRYSGDNKRQQSDFTA